jgi:hypothetical protein
MLLIGFCIICIPMLIPQNDPEALHFKVVHSLLFCLSSCSCNSVHSLNKVVVPFCLHFSSCQVQEIFKPHVIYTHQVHERIMVQSSFDCFELFIISWERLMNHVCLNDCMIP